MKTLLEFMEIADFNDLEKTTNLLERDLSHILNKTQNRENPVSQFPQEELNHKLGEAIKRLEAARTGLGLANRLKKPEDKKKNKSRIMRNLNLLRHIVQDVEYKLSAENKDVMGDDLQEQHIGFKKLEKKLAAKGANDPAALAASIGRKKYGKKKFQAAAKKGEKLDETNIHPDLVDAAREHSTTPSKGKRIATKSGLSADADLNDNPFEGRATKAARAIAKKLGKK